MELTKIQLETIKVFLKKFEIKNPALEDEFLDHIATEIEVKMANGSSFVQAQQESFAAFKKDEIQEIQSQILSLYQKQIFMKKLSLATLGTLFITSLLWAIKVDPPSRSPLTSQYSISSHFGNRIHPIKNVKKMHLGVDFKAPIGTPVYATADGEVSKIQTKNSGYGNMILIKHSDGYESLYAQLSKIQVIDNQIVKKGDLIGLVGNSGTSTGPHLHYEVRKNGAAVDPISYFNP